MAVKKEAAAAGSVSELEVVRTTDPPLPNSRTAMVVSDETAATVRAAIPRERMDFMVVCFIIC